MYTIKSPTLFWNKYTWIILDRINCSPHMKVTQFILLLKYENYELYIYNRDIPFFLLIYHLICKSTKTTRNFPILTYLLQERVCYSNVFGKRLLSPVMDIFEAESRGQQKFLFILNFTMPIFWKQSTLDYVLNRKLLSDCNWTPTHNHFVRKRTLNHLAKLASLAKWLSIRLRTKWLLESSCSHLNF